MSGQFAENDAPITRRRTEDEARKCSQEGCPGDGRYQPPGRGHLPACEHTAVKWVWEEIPDDGLRDRIHKAATLAINAVYGTDDKHAYMGLRIAQKVVDGTPLPWKWDLRSCWRGCPIDTGTGLQRHQWPCELSGTTTRVKSPAKPAPAAPESQPGEA